MWSKRNRLTVCVEIFEELYWKDIPEKSSHEHFTISELETLIPGDKEDKIETKLVKLALLDFKTKGEEYYQAVFAEYMDNWDKTLDTVRSVLYTWILESEATGQPKEELVGKYIKLTQDIVAGGNTGLVHALLSKVSGTYHESTKTQPGDTSDKEDTVNS
jgi:hypothetical protein